MESFSINKILNEFVKTDPTFINFYIEDLKKGYHSRKGSEPDHPDIKKYKGLFQKNLTEKQLEGIDIPSKVLNYQKFFDSTMDEARQYYADEFAEFILFRSDMMDAAYFRNVISRKELAREVDYDKHRDHAGHTVNNYLLGWYFYCNCDPIKREINKKIDWLQKITSTNIKYADFFGNAWVNASLMHDIGYIFEGAIPSLTNEQYNERVRQGAAVIQTFFYHRFWFDSKLDSRTIRHTLSEVLKFEIEDYNEAISLIQLGDKLTTLPNIDHIQDASPKVTTLVNDRLKYFDSFELWKTFSKKIYFNPSDPETSKLIKRVENLKDSYYEKMYKGVGESGSRMMDHGVSSGLLLLLYHSYFYTIYFQLKNGKAYQYSNKPEDSIDYDELKDFLLQRLPYKHYDYFPEWYFTGILWSTLATAIHNLQEEDPSKWFNNNSLSETDDFRLSLTEDPLSFLGILVDILQEWDRQRTFPAPTLVGRLPVQSGEVRLITKSLSEKACEKANNFEKNSVVNSFNATTRLCIIYDDADCAQKVGKDLLKSLKESWRYVLVFSSKAFSEILSH
jgi:hypothetical protein